MTDGSKRDDDEGTPTWIDRHLPKILVAGAVFCGLALIGRALTG